MITLRAELASAGAAAVAPIDTAGALTQSLRESAGLVGILAFSTGATIYPVMLVLFPAIATLSGFQIALNLPTALQEMVWLILKGFRPTLVDARPPLSRQR